MTDSDLIFYQFSRSKAERGDFRHFLSLYAPDKLPTGRRLREMMDRFVFCIDGYGDDLRENHAIPEIRRFYSARVFRAAQLCGLTWGGGRSLSYRRMGKKSRLKKHRQNAESPGNPGMWASDEGVHTLGIGLPPSDAELAAMTAAYQEQIRKSPLWDQMVNEFGEQQACAMLKEFKVR